MVRAGIDEQDVQEALDFLLDTVETAARAIAVVDAGEYRLRQARAAALLTSRETSSDRREADAITSPGYERALRELEEATRLKFEIIHRRRHAELKIEVWRSLNANKRQEKL